MFVRSGTTGDDVGKRVGGNDTVGTCDWVGGTVGGTVGDDVGRLTGEEVGSTVVGALLSIGDTEGIPGE